MKTEFVKENAQTAVDTLTSSYSDQWAGAGAEESSAFIQFMASNDLIFVVLGVSLIIWFTLFFMIKVDRNVSKLEETLKEEKNS